MTKTLDRKPATTPRSYDADLYGWVEDQVALLRAGEVGSIDASHIAQELDELGRSEFNKLVSALRIVLQHLLKRDYQPERRSRSWANSIQIQRRHIDYEIRHSPSLKRRIMEAMELAYFDATRRASDETGLPPETFPGSCPYSWEDVTSRLTSWDQGPISERH